MRLGYVILYVPKVVAAVEFYERAFGLARRFVHESGRYAEMENRRDGIGFRRRVVRIRDLPHLQA